MHLLVVAFPAAQPSVGAAGGDPGGAAEVRSASSSVATAEVANNMFNITAGAMMCKTSTMR